MQRDDARSLGDTVDYARDNAVERSMNRGSPCVALARGHPGDQCLDGARRVKVVALPLVDFEEVVGIPLTKGIDAVAWNAFGRRGHSQPVLATKGEVDHDRVRQTFSHHPDRTRFEDASGAPGRRLNAEYSEAATRAAVRKTFVTGLSGCHSNHRRLGGCARLEQSTIDHVLQSVSAGIFTDVLHRRCQS